jgi:mannose-6-phosphate isomerase-like protein (cupin superfamily)
MARLIKSHYPEIEPYITKDGSEIRELMHPSVHGSCKQSLAEATVPVGGKTLLHKHRLTEEIYHVIAGSGTMRLGSDTFSVRTGDTICIPPGTPHALENTADCALRVLCSCSPAYDHDDTEVLSSGNP